jgi:hypothetical protein
LPFPMQDTVKARPNGIAGFMVPCSHVLYQSIFAAIFFLI